MNINEIIKGTMSKLISANESEKDVLKRTLAVQKLIKTAFMEYVTDEKNIKVLAEAKNGDKLVFSSHEETIDNKTVTIIDEDVNKRVELLPESIQQSILEEMNRVRLKNIKVYEDAGRKELVEKEKFESDIISEFLPKEATEEDINEYLNQYYPVGVEKKSMGIVINEIKNAFDRVNGGLIATCIKRRLV